MVWAIGRTLYIKSLRNGMRNCELWQRTSMCRFAHLGVLARNRMRRSAAAANLAAESTMFSHCSATHHRRRGPNTSRASRLPQQPPPHSTNVLIAAKFKLCSFITRIVGRNYYKKAVLSQRWPRNAPYIWVPWKFSGLPDYGHGHYSQHFHGLLFRSTLWMFLQNLKSVALPVPEIIGNTQKIWAVPGYAHVPFFAKIFNGLLFGLTL